MRNCKNCKNDRICDECNILVNENKQFEAKRNLLK